MKGNELRRWARQVAMDWFERRWDVRRESLDNLLVLTYLQGSVDALAEEVTFLRERGANAGHKQ